MNVIDLLRAHARERPGAPALVDRRSRRVRAITFGELDNATSRAATILRAAGLRGGDAERMGDAVLIMQPMSIELYIVLLAVLRARLTAMFVDPGAGRGAITDACREIAPRALIGVTKACLLRLVVPSLRGIPIAYTTGPVGVVAQRWNAWRSATRFEDETCPSPTPALITFTSGSTGAPKVAVRSHGFLLAQHRALAATLRLNAGDTVATTFPVFVLSHLGSGACTVLAGGPSWTHLAGVTAIDAAPAWCARLAASCAGENGRLPELRRVVVGGGPVFPSLLDSLRECAPQAAVTTLYGSTEAEPIAHVERDQMTTEDLRDMRAGRGLLVGAPVDGIDLRVLRDDFRAQRATRVEFDAACLRAGEPGEIVVNGAHVLPGYLCGVRDEETKFRVDGAVWHRTGDAGFVDERGRVWLLGRLSARIRDANGDLYPFQVESVAADEAGVRRSALVASAGKRALMVELEPGADPATLGKVEARLAWAQLDRVVACRKIPTDHRHHSKVDYSALEKLVPAGG